MPPRAHFGEWFKRVREKLGLTQGKMAEALGLKSYISVRDIEQRADRSMRGTTAEAVLDLLGYNDEEDLDLAWRTGLLPDIRLIKTRLLEAQAIARAVDLEVEFDPALAGKLFHWLAAHPPRQLREILRAVSTSDAAAVLGRLAERVAEGDGGGGGGSNV